MKEDNVEQKFNAEEFLDQRRWLLNNGIISDDIKNQLFMCGSIVHKDVQAVELEIVPENKLIQYRIYVNKDLLFKIEKYSKLSKSTSVFGLWRFKRFLKKEGSLDFQQVLHSFIKDYCGPKWRTTVEVVDFASYKEDFGAVVQDDYQY